MAKSAEVKLAIFGRAGVGKSDSISLCSPCWPYVNQAGLELQDPPDSAS
uniref:RAS-like, estrogen-regulated, growth-inhibitor n=1 Tax=Mus musculus TaxID=10090 RepID=A0A0N4SV09_MOUSE